MIKIRLADTNDKEKWDNYVLTHDSGGPYLLFAWKTAVETAYQHKAFYYLAEDDEGNLQGVLPLIYIKPPFFKGVLTSLPFCDYGNVLARTNEVKRELLKTAINQSRSMKVLLEIRCRDSEPVLEEMVQVAAKTHKVRMILELPKSSEELWSQFRTKTRTKIRRPAKDGIYFKSGHMDLLNDFYQVMCINMRDLGSPVHSKGWFASIVKEYRENVLIGMLYKEQTPVSGGIIMCCGNTVTIPWSSTIKDYNHLNPNMFLYWEFLKYSSDNGYKHFDFGRSSPGEGTYVFKQQWGAKPYLLYWYANNLKKDEQEDSHSQVRAYAEKIWSRIPQSMTDTVGPIVRRFITL